MPQEEQHAEAAVFKHVFFLFFTRNTAAVSSQSAILSNTKVKQEITFS